MVYFLAAYSIVLALALVAVLYIHCVKVAQLKAEKEALGKRTAEQSKAAAARIRELKNDLMETGIAIGDHETKNRDLERENQLLRDSLKQSSEESDHLNKRLNDVVSRMETIRNCVEHPY